MTRRGAVSILCSIFAMGIATGGEAASGTSFEEESQYNCELMSYSLDGKGSVVSETTKVGDLHLRADEQKNSLILENESFMASADPVTVPITGERLIRLSLHATSGGTLLPGTEVFSSATTSLLTTSLMLEGKVASWACKKRVNY
ncbi:MAG: hypothetical protein AB7T49_14395 [Oligoflexales bacterium]